jgi:hypothetical protein
LQKKITKNTAEIFISVVESEKVQKEEEMEMRK